MKKVLIISPDWIPSNLVGIQRARLICNFMDEFNWKPIIVTVDPKYYTLPVVEELKSLVYKDVEVHKVKAFGRKKLPFCTASTLRGFWQLYRKAVEICRTQKIDFIWHPIPPGAALVIARMVHDATGVPYGADYTDPWVENGYKLLSKKGISCTMATVFEPYAVKKASFLAGVSELSYTPVIERSPHLKGIPCAAFPLGYDIHDYSCTPKNKKLVWDNEKNVKPILYAGAFLPKSHYYIEKLFFIISKLKQENRFDKNIKLYFIGTGKGTLPTVAEYAKKYGIEDIVFENTNRISYLEVLHHLNNAYGVLALGSTEEHYTASKIFQTVLSKKRVFAVFHYKSTVNKILEDCNANKYLVSYNQNESEVDFMNDLQQKWELFILGKEQWKVKFDSLEPYSARSSAKILCSLMERCLNEKI